MVNIQVPITGSICDPVSSLRTPTNTSRVKFEKHRRIRSTFLNIRLKVVHKKDTTTMESTKEAVKTSFKIFVRLRRESNVSKIYRNGRTRGRRSN